MRLDDVGPVIDAGPLDICVDVEAAAGEVILFTVAGPDAELGPVCGQHIQRARVKRRPTCGYNVDRSCAVHDPVRNCVTLKV